MGTDFAREILRFEKNARESDEEALTNNNEALINMGRVSIAEMESTIARNWNKPSKVVVVRAALLAIGNVLSSRIKDGLPIEPKNENYLRWCMEKNESGKTIGAAAKSLCKIVEAKMDSKADSREKNPALDFLYLMHAMLKDRTEKGLISDLDPERAFMIYEQMTTIISACKDNDIVVRKDFESEVEEKRNQLQIEKSYDSSGSGNTGNTSDSGDTNDSAEENVEKQTVTDLPASSSIEDRIRRGELSQEEWRNAVFSDEISSEYIDELSKHGVTKDELVRWYERAKEPKIVSANVQLMVDLTRKGRTMTREFKEYIRSEEGFRDSILSKSFQYCYDANGGTPINLEEESSLSTKSLQRPHNIDFYDRDYALPILALADDKCMDDSAEDVIDRSRATILIRKSFGHGVDQFGGDLDAFAQYLSKIPGINTLVHAAPLFHERCGETVLIPDAIVIKEAATYHAFDPKANIAVNYLCAPHPHFERDWYLGTEGVRYTDSSPYVENKCISDAVLKMHNIDTPDSISFISPRDPMSNTARAMLLERPNVYNLELLSRDDIISIVNAFMSSQDGGIGIPDPVHKSSTGTLAQEVWMLKAGVEASTIADHIHTLDMNGKSSILQERVNSPKVFDKKMGGKEMDCSVRSLISPDISGQSAVTGIYARVGEAGVPVNIPRGGRGYFLDQWVNLLDFQIEPDEVENQVKEITRDGYECLKATISQDPLYQTSGNYAFVDHSSLMGADIMFRLAVTVRARKVKALYDEIAEQLPKPTSPWISNNETSNAALRMRPDHRRGNGWIILPVHQGTEQKRVQLSDSFQETAKGLKWDSVTVTIVEFNSQFCSGHIYIGDLSSELPDDDKNVKKWERGKKVRKGQAYAIAGDVIRAMQMQKLLGSLSSSEPTSGAILPPLGFEIRSDSSPQPFPPPPRSSSPSIRSPEPPESAQSADSPRRRSESVQASALTGRSGTHSGTQSQDGEQDPPPATENDPSLPLPQRNGSLASRLARVLSCCCCVPWQGRSRGRGSNNRT